MKKYLYLLLALVFVAVPAHAKSSQTETIRIVPKAVIAKKLSPTLAVMKIVAGKFKTKYKIEEEVISYIENYSIVKSLFISRP
jgi:hypothetical protein